MGKQYLAVDGEVHTLSHPRQSHLFPKEEMPHLTWENGKGHKRVGVAWCSTELCKERLHVVCLPFHKPTTMMLSARACTHKNVKQKGEKKPNRRITSSLAMACRSWMPIGQLPIEYDAVSACHDPTHSPSSKEWCCSLRLLRSMLSIHLAASTYPEAQRAAGNNRGPEQSPALWDPSTASSGSLRPTSQPLPNPFVQSCAFY